MKTNIEFSINSINVLEYNIVEMLKDNHDGSVFFI